MTVAALTHCAPPQRGAGSNRGMGSQGVKMRTLRRFPCLQRFSPQIQVRS